MKKTLILAALAFAAIGANAQQPCANPQLLRGIGPAINVNNNPQYGTDIRVLPENAQTFINTLFPNVAVASVENDLKDKQWEVKMADGFEVNFDYNGNWTEVESPRNAMLPSETVKALIPENVVIATLTGDQIVNGGIVNYVEEIDYVPGFGYVVEYAASDQASGKVAIDTNGNVKTMREFKAMSNTGKNKMAANKGQKGTKSKKGAKKGCKGQNARQQNCGATANYNS